MKKTLLLIFSMLIGGFCFAQSYQTFTYEETKSVDNSSSRSVAYHCAMAFVNQNFTKFESLLTPDYKNSLKTEMQKNGMNYTQLFNHYLGTNPVQAIRPVLNMGYEPVISSGYEEKEINKAKWRIAFIDSQFNSYLNREGNQELSVYVKMINVNGSWKVYKIEFNL